MKWKEVVGFDVFEVSDEGTVRKAYYGKLQKFHSDVKIGKFNHGYRRVCLSNEAGQSQKLLHRVVLEAFVGPCPEGMEACHNDGDKDNNKLSNLRWDTHANNQLDKLVHGTLPLGEKCHNSIFNEEDIHFIRHMVSVGISDSVICSFFKTTSQSIQAIRYGNTWGHLATKPLSLEVC